MTCSAIIRDWNGTLYEDFEDEAILRAIAVGLGRSYVPWHPLKFMSLLKAKNELETLNNKRNRDLGTDRVIEIFRVYNEKVIKGAAMSLVRHSVERFSERRQVQDKVVHRALRPIADFHRTGTATGILSAGYRYGIEMILKSAGYIDCFDFCEANLLGESDGKATGFTLTIYKNKAEILLTLLRNRNLDPKKAAYLGDSLDEAGCFEAIGHPIVSFLAPDELKERFAKDYGAFIPRDEAELARYLQSI
jgi:phosphoglycolate phosphatase-like HAD superfamily hydrolase